MKTENVIVDMTFDFALQIVELYKKLVIQKEFVLSKQLLKCGTSIGANVEEAIAAQSKKDFISKMSIAAKEARETRYFLRILDRSKLVDMCYTRYIEFVTRIMNVLTKIVMTSQRSLDK
ncbi:MAG: hypothetical protein JWN78_2363 [Bacteroidota bacterium]|nr:hypothetical protein [Bacteroidota bacterium]